MAIVSPAEKRIKKLEDQIHYLVELIDEHQLELFMAFCLNQNKSL